MDGGTDGGMNGDREHVTSSGEVWTLTALGDERSAARHPGPGDPFVVRAAGHVRDAAAAVLGHDRCGAVPGIR